MNLFTNRQVAMLCVLSMSVGAVFSPPLQSLAQPPEASRSQDGPLPETPQPLATPPVSSSVTSSSSGPSTRSMTTQAVGPITGTGSTGNIAKFTGANTIGNSVLFENADKVGIGTTTPTGVFSVNNGTAGVYGIYSASTGNGVGGTSSRAIGVYGLHTTTTGAQSGVLGETHSTADNAIGTAGVILSTSPGAGSAGLRGINNGTGGNGYGVYGSQAGYGTGVYGTSGGYGVYGTSTGGYGVYGTSTNGTAVYGTSTNGTAVYGTSTNGTAVYGASTYGTGLSGSSSSRYGVYGYSSSSYGVYAASSTNTAVRGSSSGPYGVYGSSGNSIGRGLYGIGYVGVEGGTNSANGYAGDFTGLVYIKGDLIVTGQVSKGGGSFKIDHPLHPATEYLSHSFVESPDMMNIYNGNATTNSQGEAWVTLPDYFHALNGDFRYQLTPIGQFARAIVGQEIVGNRFQIKTDKPHVKVSWQVTGIRHDAYARAHPIAVEQTKTGADQGKYLYPAGFGAGSEKQIGPRVPRLAKR